MCKKRIARLHYITQDVDKHTYAELAEAALRGGVSWVQLRVKGKSYDEWKDIALEVQDICAKYEATLIINDNVQLAYEIHAHGVHLGQQDMSPAEARKVLGEDFIIGGTANTLEEVQQLHEAGVDYIGIGPYRFTTTKEKLGRILGIEGIRQLAAAAHLPLIAIGGIRQQDVELLLQAGVYGIAVASAINLAENSSEAARCFVHILNDTLKKHIKKYCYDNAFKDS